MNTLPEPTRLTLYVDGSCDGNQNVDAETPAGWGFVVIVGDSGLGRGSGDLVTEKNGPVVTSPSEPEFIGAEVGSNNTAELQVFLRLFVGFLQKNMTTLFVFGQIANTLETSHLGPGKQRQIGNLQHEYKHYGTKLHQ